MASKVPTPQAVRGPFRPGKSGIFYTQRTHVSTSSDSPAAGFRPGPELVPGDAGRKLTQGRRLKTDPPWMGYSDVEGLMLVTEEAVEIRVLSGRARAFESSHEC